MVCSQPVEPQSWPSAEETAEEDAFVEPEGPNCEVAERMGWMQEVMLESVLNELRKVEQPDEMPVGIKGFADDDAPAAELEEVYEKSFLSDKNRRKKERLIHSQQLEQQPRSQGQKVKQMTSS